MAAESYVGSGMSRSVPKAVEQYKAGVYMTVFPQAVKDLPDNLTEARLAAWLGFTTKTDLRAFISRPSVVAARAAIRHHRGQNKLWAPFIDHVLRYDAESAMEAYTAWAQAACYIIGKWHDCPLNFDSLRAFHAVFCLLKWIDRTDGFVPRSPGSMDVTKELFGLGVYDKLLYARCADAVKRVRHNLAKEMEIQMADNEEDESDGKDGLNEEGVTEDAVMGEGDLDNSPPAIVALGALLDQAE